MGKREYCPPGWSQPAGQYEGWNGQYPQQGWDGQNPQQGWDPTQYPQQGWQTGQNPQGWDSHQGWDPNLQGWDGQPGAQIDDVQSTPAAAIGQGDVDNLQNDPNYYFDSNGERGPGWYGPSGAFFPATQAYEPNAQPDLSYMAEGTPAGTTGTDHEHISEPVGGIPFSDAPQPTRKSQYWIIAVAAILVVAIGAGIFFYLRSKSGATKAVPATASKPAASASKSPTPEVTVTSTSTATAGATSVAPASATPMPSVPNDASTTPSPDLVRQLFNAPDAQVQWVSLAADGQNAAVAYASTFNINGKSAGPNGGHLVMRKNGSHWEPLSQGGVIVDDNDCDAMLKTLGDKAATPPAPSATSVATQQRGSGWVIALLAVLVLVGAGVFFYVKGMPGSHSDAAPQPTQAPISTSTPEVRPTRTVTAHATVTTMSSPIQIQLPGGAVECGQGAWIANPRTTCPLALEVVRSVPANHPASFAIDAQDPRTGKSRHFSCNTVGQYVDCGSQDLEVYLVIPG